MFIASVLKLLLYAAKRVLKVSFAVPHPSEGFVQIQRFGKVESLMDLHCSGRTEVLNAF